MMINLRAAIAMEILNKPRRFSADEFLHLAVERGFCHKNAVSGVLCKWRSEGLVVVVGSKKCNASKGKDLYVYEINESKRHELRRIVSRARKAPTRGGAVDVSVKLSPSNCADMIGAWLDGITRARLAV